MNDKLLNHNDAAKINSLDTDYRAEVIAAEMIEAGQDADKLLILRGKNNTRNTSKDVYKINYTHLAEDFTEFLCIYTTRKSIYDNLPEGISHQQDFNKIRYTEDIGVEIKKQREEELTARLFFQPFEAAVDKILTDARLYEKKYHKSNFYDNLKTIFIGYWPLFKLMDVRQAAFFIRIIPEIYRIPTDFNYMGQVLSIIFDIPVRVEAGKIGRIPTDKEENPKLGKTKLGINFVLKGDALKDTVRSIRITIGPMPPEAARLFVAKQKNYILLEELSRFILPFNSQREIKYLTIKGQSSFRLSDDKHKAYLGINTTLQ